MSKVYYIYIIITKEIYIFITMIYVFHYAYSLLICKSIEWMN